MQVVARKTCLLILLSSAFFLAAQFHYGCDLTAAPSAASHVCPLCGHPGIAILAPQPDLSAIPVADRLEIAPVLVTSSPVVPRSTSPRAPPAIS